MMDALNVFVGTWELIPELPGAADIRGRVVFERVGELLVQRTSVPVPEVPDSCCVVVAAGDGGYTQHYFDSRGIARLYAMSFDGQTWTLERRHADFTPLEFCQRFVGRLSDDHATIESEWQTSADGSDWHLDFGLTYRRLDAF